jgi:hypothetical protein
MSSSKSGTTGDAVFFPSAVVLFGEDFVVQTDGAAETTCTLSCAGGVMQSVDIHTSCSWPLYVGQDFGALVIAEFPGECGAPPVAEAPPQQAPASTPCGCDAGTNNDFSKPTDIEFVVRAAQPTGGLTMQNGKGGSSGDAISGSCQELTVVCYANGQAAGGSEAGAAKGAKTSSKRGRRADFLAATTVQLGDRVVVNTGGAPETECTVTCVDGGAADTAQTIDIHTSCSYPLFVGQSFGALEITDFPAQCTDAMSHELQGGSASNSNPAQAQGSAWIVVVAALTVTGLVALVAVASRRHLLKRSPANHESDPFDSFDTSLGDYGAIPRQSIDIV